MKSTRIKISIESKLFVYFNFRSVKFHHVKEAPMMLVAFWRPLVKIVVVFQHKRQRHKSFSRFLDNLKTPTRTVYALHYSMQMN